MPDLSASERWKRIDAAFELALDLDPAEWSSFLDRHCGDDEEIRGSVERLLAADVESDSSRFLAESAESVVGEAFVEALRQATGPDGGGAPGEPGGTDRSGERLGAWQLVRQIGRGGMASVYLAERADGQFEQTAAIKIIRRGLDTDDFIRRFLAERQILSSLHHPNIATLIGGGATEDGLPYLVLEYVDGRPITEYCDEHRLPVGGRLELFEDAARAVQYAHANLVVHRDIKPSNILVTADGVVKLLDFGIAKLLDPDANPSSAVLTRTGHRPLTPEYASPEQVAGDPITTASDVYQLGVLLYRLLTGGRPYGDTRPGPALEIAITETKPILPSLAANRLDPDEAANRGAPPGRLRRRLRGDLDVIILKALRKDPGRRYGSAVEMAEDVRRHLEDLPILARRESRVHRSRKFLRRNPWFAPTVAVVAVLVGAYVATLVRHGQELESERDVARDVQSAFVGFFTAPDSTDGRGLGEGRRDITVREAILEGADRVRRDLADRPAARAELFGAMAEVLADLDELRAARELAGEALALEEDLYGPRSPEVHETLGLAGSLAGIGDSARALLGRHLRLSRELYGKRSPEVAVSLHHLGLLERTAGNLPESVGLFEEAATILRASDPRDGADRRRLAWVLGFLAEAYTSLDRNADALAASREAHELMRTAFGDEHSDTAIHGIKLAGALRTSGELSEARRLYQSSLRTLDAELGPTHSMTLNSRGNYALLLQHLGDYEGAESVQRRLLSASRERYGDISPEVARVQQNLAVTLKSQGRLAEADSAASAAFERYLATRGESHYQTAFPLLTLAEIRLATGDLEPAREAASRAARILGATLPDDHYATAVAVCREGRALLGLGQTSEGRSLLGEAAEVLRTVASPRVAAYRSECLEALAGVESGS